jgi:hypothetical protein
MRDAARQSERAGRGLRDRALPKLEVAIDAAGVEPRLRELLGAHGGLTVRVLKHTLGKRCVLGYEWQDGTRVVAKLYRKDRARRHAAALADLQDLLRGDVRAPRLLACWEDLGAVVQEWVPGRPMPDYALLRGEEALVERIGTALGEFHAAPVRHGELTDLRAQVRRTCHPGLEVLAADAPELGDALRQLEREIYDRERRWPYGVGPCHGDFGPRQVFVDGPRTYLVDLDGLCRGDPALDVASFRVGLRTHLGTAGHELGELFLAAYLARRGLRSLPTLAHHEAFCELRRAVILWRKRPAGWEDGARRLIESGRSGL